MKRNLVNAVFACALAAGFACYGAPQKRALRVRPAEAAHVQGLYHAENGFTDWYDGKRYRPANDKAAYLSPVSGYINWK